MAKGQHKKYPRFEADFCVLDHLEFIDAFAKRDSRLSPDVFAGFVPISFARMLEIAVHQNREQIAPGHFQDFEMRGRGILESAIVEQGTIAGAQGLADFLLDSRKISKQEWQEMIDWIAISSDEIVRKFAELSVNFLKDLVQNIGRKERKGRPSLEESAATLESLIDTGLIHQAAQVTVDDLENSVEGTKRRLIPIVRNAVQRGVLARAREENGETVQEAVDKHMKRLKRRAESILHSHVKEKK